MATRASEKVNYPTSDGGPIAETDLHRDLMIALIKILQSWFGGDPMVYVSGNLLVFYTPGDRLRHLSPDVFVVKGVANHRRDNYLIWEEGKGLDLVIELTSSSTKEEDVEDKFWLYQDMLRVPEYFLFDPRGEYLAPPLQGWRLHEGKYARIAPVAGRLPSEVLGLNLERHGSELCLFDPATGRWLLTPEERIAQEIATRQQAEKDRQLAEQARQQLEQACQLAQQARQLAEQARSVVEAENEQLRRKLEDLRRAPPPQP